MLSARPNATKQRRWVGFIASARYKWCCHNCVNMFDYIAMVLSGTSLTTIYILLTAWIFSLAFSIIPGNIIAKLGFPARLDCQTNLPGHAVRWARGDNTVLRPAECNCYTLSNSSLYFNQTTPATGGDYTCFIFGQTFAAINGSITIAGESCIITNIIIVN